MAKYIRKPIIVEAAQWFPEVGDKLHSVYPRPDGKTAIVYRGHDDFVVEPGDWCVLGENMDIFVYSDEEFHKLFEEVFPGYKGQP